MLNILNYYSYNSGFAPFVQDYVSLAKNHISRMGCNGDYRPSKVVMTVGTMNQVLSGPLGPAKPPGSSSRVQAESFKATFMNLDLFEVPAPAEEGSGPKAPSLEPDKLVQGPGPGPERAKVRNTRAFGKVTQLPGELVTEAFENHLRKQHHHRRRGPLTEEERILEERTIRHRHLWSVYLGIKGVKVWYPSAP